VAFYLTVTRDWQRLERVSADEWLRRSVGERAYSIWWKPLLVSKFGEEHYRDVNMAWLWARAYKRTARLGYFAGGFQRFIDLLVARVRSQSGEVRLENRVLRVQVADGGRLRLDTASGIEEFDRVIATCSPQRMIGLVPQMPSDYAQGLSSLQSMGAVVLILALKRPMTQGHYWINIPAGEGLPFMGLIEHTNYIASEHYGGDHLVYCGDYLPADHPYLGYGRERLLSTYLPGLRKINPDFSLDWVRKTWAFSEPYAQPIPTLDQSRKIPPMRTPIRGLWMANMSLVYPWDRGTNYAIEMGRRVAREIAR
jgi:protoporphyrinogen oxidase